jgi:hypothetical protein
MLSLLMALACSGKTNGDHEAPAASAPAEAQSEAPPMAPPPPDKAQAPGAIVATWLGEPCGERPYPREITFTPDFRYHGRDLVSPCPEGVTCVWSGVLEFSGTWQGDAALLTLSEESGQDNELAQPRPTTMRHTHSGHLTTEPREGVICSFTKQEAAGSP